MPANTGFIVFIKRFYDKLIALAAVVILLVGIGTLVIGRTAPPPISRPMWRVSTRLFPHTPPWSPSA